MTVFKLGNNFFLEILVTFQMVFIGTGSIVVSLNYPGFLGDFGIGVCFGFSIYAGIMLFGRLSKAHMNPAATLFLLLEKKINKKIAGTLILAQFIGAFAASFLLSYFAPTVSELGSTTPHAGVFYSWWIEFGLTSILLITLCFLSKARLPWVALLIGLVIFFEAWLAGPLTGASMNPFRSLAPALVSGNSQYVWVYITAPLAASVFVHVLNSKFKLDEIF
jgi:aquaporin NIP